MSVQTGTRWSADGTAVGLVAQFGLLAALTAGVGLGWVGWLSGATFAVFTWAVLSHALRRSGAGSLGAANAVTLARATLVGGVAALVADSPAGKAPVAALVGLAGVALLLDAVDGQVARRTGTATALGARFDMETDAFLILVLSVFVARSFGGWVLAIGALRYLFVAAAWLLPWLRAALPPQWSRKAVAAVQGIVLVVAAAGVLPPALAGVAVGLALALLVWSFCRDVGGLWRRRTALAVVPAGAAAPAFTAAAAAVAATATVTAGTAPLPPRVVVGLAEHRTRVRVPV